MQLAFIPPSMERRMNLPIWEHKLREPLHMNQLPTYNNKEEESFEKSRDKWIAKKEKSF